MQPETSNENSPNESQNQKPKKPSKLPLHLPIPDDNPLFDGATIVIVQGDLNVAQNYPGVCKHNGNWRPSGIELDTDVIFIEDTDCIPVECEECRVGTNLSQDCSLSDGKIV